MSKRGEAEHHQELGQEILPRGGRARVSNRGFLMTCQRLSQKMVCGDRMSWTVGGREAEEPLELRGEEGSVVHQEILCMTCWRR